MPLKGIRVLDVGRYIAGPYCAALLADYGAEVIRIEAPGGNYDRYTVPVADDGSSEMFMQMNRAKRCLTLKPGSPEGREIVRRLVDTAAVVIANLPHDALVKLGLDHDSLSAINPRAVSYTHPDVYKRQLYIHTWPATSDRPGVKCFFATMNWPSGLQLG